MRQKEKNKPQAFTLIELIVVIVIVGILAGIAIPAYSRAREQALDKEAQINIRLIHAAQRAYHMLHGVYVDCQGAWSADSETCINNNLKLSIPPNNGHWNYEVWGDGSGAPGCVHCQRNLPNNQREWGMCIDDTEPRLMTGSGDDICRDECS